MQQKGPGPHDSLAICKATHMKNEKYKNWLMLPGIVLFVLALGWMDWHTGYELNFFVFYFIPIGIAARFFGIHVSILFSLLCAVVWFFADNLSGHTYSSNHFATWNTFIRLGSFVLIGWFVNQLTILYTAEIRKTEDLQKALSEIKTLKSFLSICYVCKKIRNDNNNWQQLESYISEHSDTLFSHGLCSECAEKSRKEEGIKKG